MAGDWQPLAWLVYLLVLQFRVSCTGSYSTVSSFVLLQCAVNTLCGVPISSDLQQLLGTAPDYCSIVSECQVQPCSMRTLI